MPQNDIKREKHKVSRNCLVPRIDNRDANEKDGRDSSYLRMTKRTEKTKGLEILRASE